LDKSQSQQFNVFFSNCFYILTKIVATGNDLPTDGFFRLVVMNSLDLILYPIPSGNFTQCNILLPASNLFLWAIFHGDVGYVHQLQWSLSAPEDILDSAVRGFCWLKSETKSPCNGRTFFSESIEVGPIHMEVS
jgi:hypothetical protein